MNTLINTLKLHKLNYSISNKSTIPIMSNSIINWASKDGQFRRQVSAFRSEIKKGTEFPPEVGRYHLVVSDACPWAHRVKILRSLKGLEGILPMSIVHPFLGEKGWSFDISFNGSTGCRIPNLNVSHLRDVYFKADPNYSARFTVPIIYDTVKETIVSNESSEIIRFLNTCFDDFIDSDKASINTYPEHARKEIDELNSWVYDKINNGVYKSGFASTQTAYESNVVPLFEALDKVEGILSDGRQYLVANQLTEADIRLYTTIVK